MPMNPAFNVNRGTAYILYEEIDDAERAIAKMHDAQLDGAKLQVSIVLPRRRFSQTPPPARNRGPPPRPERFDGGGYGDRVGGPPGAYRPPPMGRGRDRSPRGGFRGGRGGRGRGGGGYGGYRPRSYSRSRSRSPRRSRSRSSYSRSISRTPPPRRGGGRRESPPRNRGRGGRGGDAGGGGRRSPSYSSYGSRSPRDRSRSRDRR